MSLYDDYLLLIDRQDAEIKKCHDEIMSLKIQVSNLQEKNRLIKLILDDLLAVNDIENSVFSNIESISEVLTRIESASFNLEDKMSNIGKLRSLLLQHKRGLESPAL